MSQTVRPRIVISRCIEHAACRWNGLIIRSDAVKILRPFVEFLPVCPENDCGLGCPRDPVRVVETGGELRLLQPATGRDCTGIMQDFCAEFLDGVGEDVDCFLLKSRSPSCGAQDVKIYARAESRGAKRKGRGFFGAAVLDRFGHLPVEDEGRLRNYSLREEFLTAIWTRARFRAARRRGKMRDLVAFHADHKFLLQARGENEMRALGRVVANRTKRRPAEVFADYGERLGGLLRRAPSVKRNINVLQHAMGFFKKGLSSAEKAYFLKTLEAYRRGRVPMSSPAGVIRAWIARFDQKYLAAQRFFEPYPGELVSVTDSGTGRKLR